MKILVGKTFGIGNAVMAVPMIKALQCKPDAIVDVLVGNTPDDVGAFQVLSKVVRPPGKIFVNSALEGDYDVAVMAIPFDGRWRNGIHFKAKTVIDGRTRPDPSTTGLVSWKEHEVRYQMKNARDLGFVGFDPSTSFMPFGKRDKDRIYVGLGYKKDTAGFWKAKHWGNDNYSRLISEILQKHPEKKIITTGDAADMQLSVGPISRSVSDSRFEFRMSSNLDEAFRTISDCGTYVGNDTGMMHVAAACGLDVVALFFLENSIVKSSPLQVVESQNIEIVDGTKDRNVASVDNVMKIVGEMLDER